MSNLSIEINGTEYELSTKLRVAYMVQGQHNHKPYSDVFREVGDMCLEDQIGIVYCAFKCANPLAANQINQKAFEDYYLDNYKLGHLIQQINDIIRAIMGEEFADDLEKQAAAEDPEESAGN